jgi:ArsR family transcriptional regulator
MIPRMPDAVALLAALAEPTRLAALRLAGLVVDRRDAQWVRYRLNPDMPPAVRHVMEAALDLPPRQESLAA